MSFGRRWLAGHGVAGPDLLRKLRSAQARIGRFPAFCRPAFRLAPLVVEWLGPLLALGRLGVASRLSPADFDRLVDRFEAHPSPAVRGIFLLARVPLLDQVTPDVVPAPAAPHPLAGRARRRPVARRTYDVAVVGSGAGGAPVAWDLARRGASIAIVEAGRLATTGTVAQALERDYLHQATTVAAGEGFLPVLAGRTIGGTTSINSGTCLRPTPEALEAWDAALGGRTRYAGGEIDRWLDAAEAALGVVVPPRDLLGRSADFFERGLAALGRSGSFVLPRNAPTCRGDGRCCFVCPSGAKRSTDRAFLPGALDAGAELYAPARVVRIRETPDAVRLDLVGPEGPWSLEARRLVLAAGALSTPGLVRSSRLGSRWRLAGDGLKVHPASKVLAHFPERVDGERGVPQGLGYRTPEFPRLAFEGIFTPLAAVAPLLPLAGRRLDWWLERYAHAASFGLLIRDRATGSVRSAGDVPWIRYSIGPEDALDMGAGLIHVAEVFLAAGADRVLLPIVGTDNEVSSPAELARVSPEDFTPARLHACGFHPQGTCGMGRVVDLDLRLIGSSRIHVCDASVFPESPGVNPMLTIAALSLRLAETLAAAMAPALARPRSAAAERGLRTLRGSPPSS